MGQSDIESAVLQVSESRFWGFSGTSWTRDRPVTKPQAAENNENIYTKSAVLRMRFKPMIPLVAADDVSLGCDVIVIVSL
jgi:hypothetical protein